MRWSDLPLDPPPRTLRQFAGLCLVILGSLALWQGLVRGNHSLAVILAVLALTLGPLGMWQPSWIRPVFIASLIVTFPIGWVVSHVILGLLFYGLFLPIGLVFRMMGRDVLRLRQPQTDSYWTPKKMPEDPRRYFRQF